MAGHGVEHDVRSERIFSSDSRSDVCLIIYLFVFTVGAFLDR